MDLLSWFFSISIFALGVIIGSFLNCLIWRAHTGESAFKGRSYCPKCRHGLCWRDLVPVFSFLYLRGKCRYCKKPISWQYPAVELATGALFVAAAQAFAPELFLGALSIFAPIELLAYWTIISALAVIFVADLRWYIIPDGAVVTGLAAAVFLRGAQFFQSGAAFGGYAPWILVNPLLTATVCGAFFAALFLGSRGKWMGFGDVKYAFFMGLALGFPDALVGLFLANFFGAIIGLTLIFARKKSMSSEIPFGPFLVAGTLIALFFSGPIISWYLTLTF
jgi:prepilin signal peptidase PulO-like enzyme (type II secretory pathway)